jgi:hypothetical protein
MGADEAQGGGGRLLHHVAQLPGQRQALLALHGRGFDEQQIAAHGGPGQAHGHARRGHAALGFGGEADGPQVFGHIIHLDGGFLDFAFGDFGGHTPADGGDFALQVAQARFPGVPRDHLADGAGGET